MRDGNFVTSTVFNPFLITSFRSDYEGWKRFSEVSRFSNLETVLEVTMRDGNTDLFNIFVRLHEKPF